jgi:hypothetical protein
MNAKTDSKLTVKKTPLKKFQIRATLKPNMYCIRSS